MWGKKKRNLGEFLSNLCQGLVLCVGKGGKKEGEMEGGRGGRLALCVCADRSVVYCLYVDSQAVYEPVHISR